MALGVSWDRPPAPLSERDLWSGYGHGWRIEPCACGGAIRAATTSDGAITAAVLEHQQTDQHATWRAAWEAEH